MVDGPEQTGATLRAVYTAEAQLAALRLKLVAHGEAVGVPAHDAAVSMKAWLRDHVRLAPGEAKRQVELAKQLAKHGPTAEALTAGEIPVASAAVVVKAIEGLPTELEPEVAAKAERHLIEEAKVFDTQKLGYLAGHLDEVLDPEGADERLAQQLATAEAEAARQAASPDSVAPAGCPGWPRK